MTESVVILANGCFPTHEIPLSLLTYAGTIICTDGSADKLVSHGKSPDAIIGDMDSISSKPSRQIKTVVQSSQENTDLEKAVIWCCDQNVKNIVILGSQGERDDHGFASLFIQSAYISKTTIRLVTDYYTIDCVTGEKTFSSFPNQTISILPVQPDAIITTSGLQYNLDHQKLTYPSQGISNRAEDDSFTLHTSKPVWVFRSHE